MQAIFILLGLVIFALVISGIIYAGYWLLSYLTFISAKTAFTFADAFNIGEYITLGLCLAAIVVFILDRAGVIDLKVLRKKGKR